MKFLNGLNIVLFIATLSDIQARKNEFDISVEKRGPMAYVVSRGCPYLTHYVRKNYFSLPDNRPTHLTSNSNQNLNWVSLVYQTFIENYVPLELFHGLVTCGKDFALYAINPSNDILDNFQTNFTVIPGVGK